MANNQVSSELKIGRQKYLEDGVTFNPDQVTLQGIYSDELSAHRAKKTWIETLEGAFILENRTDIDLAIRDTDAGYLLECHFLTACARYAFWRLTNNQAPEAQYIIETAHIPLCESRHEEIMTAPDMRSIYDEPLILSGLYRLQKSESLVSDIITKIKDLVAKLNS